ncbi:acetyltransferase-like isoleucine patch superfamily enzyme [Panacagrimonas perspica]|uniref:Acetyltransferase-like isoleucine patch superfamily enzyme n=1 Tax=Panacagrimonas perspica TaxID=381431 RepID=A0A4V3F4A2_9GAMM|nr:acetyltransferase-like isoleucine patch superfamily enzyme [Panacagrimonas perspica]
MAPSARLAAEARVGNLRGDSNLITIGGSTVVRGELMVFAHGGSISIGEWCYVGPGTRIWSGASIKIGNRVLIAHNVNIFDNLTHPIDPEARHQQFRAILTRGHPKDITLDDRPVVVEDDAWIGAGSIVLRGVRIGARSIVGAGSVVTRDVAADSVVAGNPARFVRSVS